MQEQLLLPPDVFIGRALAGARPGPSNMPFTDNCDRCDVSQRLNLMQCLTTSPLAFCGLLALLFVTLAALHITDDASSYYCAGVQTTDSFFPGH